MNNSYMFESKVAAVGHLSDELAWVLGKFLK